MTSFAALVDALVLDAGVHRPEETAAQCRALEAAALRLEAADLEEVVGAAARLDRLLDVLQPTGEMHVDSAAALRTLLRSLDEIAATLGQQRDATQRSDAARRLAIEVLRLLSVRPGLTAAEIATELRSSSHALMHALRELERNGAVTRRAAPPASGRRWAWHARGRANMQP